MMSCTSLISAIPRQINQVRRFSTGSLQLIKQAETEASHELKWERAFKGVIAVAGISGLSFSAVNTAYMYDSQGQPKSYWSCKVKH